VGVEKVLYTLSGGLPVAGIMKLGDAIYVLTWKARCPEVEVYDVITYRLQRSLAMPNIRGFTDMTSCEHYRCLYIGDHIVECIHRLDVQGAATQWYLIDKPLGLSVNAAHNVLVTCDEVRKIKEFSSHGNLLRELTLPDDVIHPTHAIQLTNGQFIVCHGRHDDAVHRVCKISADGRDIIQSHGGQRGSDTGQYDVPAHLAVDNNGFVLLVDQNNQRVKLLSPALDYIRQVVPPDEQWQWWPRHLSLDTHKQLLYVVDNEVNLSAAGRVVVFAL